MTSTDEDRCSVDTSAQDASKLGEIVRVFDAAWSSGDRPALPEFLAKLPATARDSVVCELIGRDVHFRRGNGETPHLEEYLTLLPEYAELIRRIPMLGQSAPLPEALPSAFAATITAHPEEFAEPTPATMGGSDMPVQIGAYRILEEIGRGGMGVVYRAKDPYLGRSVAIKLVLDQARGNTEHLARFRLEAEAAARIDHPGIVSIYEAGEHSGLPYLVMAYVPGRSLARRIAEAPLPPQSAARILGRVAQAVHHLHRHGIIHRDLKPENVLLDADEQPRVTDFGLAKLQDQSAELTATGDVLGTPCYMAPEQARQTRDAGVPADVYSLGATLYCVITGRPPFKAATALETLRQVLEREPVAPRALNPSIPVDLETICLACLRKEPSRRYSTAAAMADDLERYLTGFPIAARPVTRFEATQRWCRRNPKLATLLSVAVLLLIMVATVSTAAYVREAALVTEKNVLAQKERDGRKRAQKLAKNEAEARRAADVAARAAMEARAKAEANALDLRVQLAKWSFGRGAAEYDAGRCRNADREFVRALALLPSGHALAESYWQVAWDRFTHGGRLLAPPLRHNNRLSQFPVDHNPSLPRREFATLTERGGVTWWDSTTGAPVAPLGDLFSVVWTRSPDQKREVHGNGQENSRWLFNTAIRKSIADIQHSAKISKTVFSPDGRFLVTCSEDETCQIWLAETGARWKEPLQHDGPVVDATFSPDSRRVASACGDRAYIWDVLSSERLPLAISQPSISRIQFSPDGETLATLSNKEPAIRLWNVAAGVETHEPIVPESAIVGMEFSPDGTVLAVATGKEAECLELAAAEPAHMVLPHEQPLTGLSFSADGASLLTGSQDGAVRIWDLTAMHPAVPLATDGVVSAGTFTADGKKVLTGTARGRLDLWDPDSLRPLATYSGHTSEIMAVVCHPDGIRLLTAGQDRTVRCWDLVSGAAQGQPLVHQAEVTLATLSSNGAWLVTTDVENRIYRWNAQTLEPRGEPQLCEERISGAQFTVDCRLLIVTSSLKNSKTIEFVDVETGAPAGTPIQVAGSPYVPPTISPDGGRILVVSSTAERAGRAQFWSLESRQPLGPFLCSSEGSTPAVNSGWAGLSHLPPLSMRLSFDGDIKEIFFVDINAAGSRIATATFSNVAQIWDASSGRAVGEPLRHDVPRSLGAWGIIRLIRFCPQGHRILTAMDDGTLRLWDTETGQRLGQEIKHKGLRLAVFSPDGVRLVTGGELPPTARL